MNIIFETLRWVFGLWVVVFLSGSADAAPKETRCPFDSSRALLNPNAVQENTHHFELRPPRSGPGSGAIEWAMLTSNVAVVIESGGCKGWGEVYQFVLNGKQPQKTSDWLKKAADLLGEVALASQNPSRIPQTPTRLVERAKQKPAYQWSEFIPILTDRPGYGGISVSTSSLLGGTAQLQIRVVLNPQ